MLLLLACGNTQKGGTNTARVENGIECSTDSVSSGYTGEDPIEDMVRAQVTTIYGQIFGWYIAHVDSMEMIDFDTEEYLSEDYMKLLRQVAQHDNELGEIGFFDGDHWIQAQDWSSDLNMQIERVEVSDSKHARCNILIHNGGSDTPLVLAVVRQGDRWYIDDFIDEARDYSEKEEMQKYLQEEDE